MLLLLRRGVSHFKVSNLGRVLPLTDSDSGILLPICPCQEDL